MVRYDFDGALDHPFTAHPKIDAKTGELFFFGYQFLRTPYLQYAVIDATGKKLPSVGIDIGEPKMIHDFAITEHYAIFLDFPLIFNNKNLFTEKGFFEFQKQKPSRIGVLPRYDTDASNMKWFDVDAAYVFHTANAWEEGNLFFSRESHHVRPSCPCSTFIPSPRSRSFFGVMH